MRAVGLGEIVENEIERQRVSLAVDLLGECVGQTGVPLPVPPNATFAFAVPSTDFPIPGNVTLHSWPIYLSVHQSYGTLNAGAFDGTQY